MTLIILLTIIFLTLYFISIKKYKKDLGDYLLAKYPIKKTVIDKKRQGIDLSKDDDDFDIMNI